MEFIVKQLPINTTNTPLIKKKSSIIKKYENKKGRKINIEVLGMIENLFSICHIDELPSNIMLTQSKYLFYRIQEGAIRSPIKYMKIVENIFNKTKYM